MSVLVSLEFFHIERCGFYERGGTRPLFGTVADTLPALQTWVSPKRINDTLTFADAEFGDVYCFGMATNNAGHWLIATWNRVETDDGKVAHLRGSSAVGSGRASTADIPPGSIPGFATYFWIIPDRNLLATVRLGQVRNGHPGLRRYLEGFLERWSPYAHGYEGGDGTLTWVITGHSEPGGDPRDDVAARFETRRVLSKQELDRIKGNRSHIFKTVWKQKIANDNNVDMAFYRRALRMLGVVNRSDADTKSGVRVEINKKLTEEELDAIFAQWEGSLAGDGEHLSPAEVGFIFERESAKVHWLSHSLTKEEFDIVMTVRPGFEVDTQELLDALYERRRLLPEAGSNV